jgi:TIR domain/Pentapeptide repeats (8 copies)
MEEDRTRRPPSRPRRRRKAISELQAGNVAFFNELRHANTKWKPDLQKRTFKESVIPGADLRGANCKEVTFAGADLTGVDFRSANLRGASFTRAILVKAKFSRANLAFVSFGGADVSEADFREARNLTVQQLESVAYAENVRYDARQFGQPMLPQRPPNIFLSYAWQDKAAVLAVDQWLRSRGAQVLIDERNFLAGESIREEILRWIGNAGVVVVFISHASKDRAYPRLEREIAETLRTSGDKRVIYFNLDDTIVDAVHAGRLYVPGYELSLEAACEKLWDAILERTRRPRKLISASTSGLVRTGPYSTARSGEPSCDVHTRSAPSAPGRMIASGAEE